MSLGATNLLERLPSDFVCPGDGSAKFWESWNSCLMKQTWGQKHHASWNVVFHLHGCLPITYRVFWLKCLHISLALSSLVVRALNYLLLSYSDIFSNNFVWINRSSLLLGHWLAWPRDQSLGKVKLFMVSKKLNCEICNSIKDNEFLTLLLLNTMQNIKIHNNTMQ